MMARDTLMMTVKLKGDISLWDAIKLRIAGADAVRAFLAERLSVTIEEDPPPVPEEDAHAV